VAQAQDLPNPIDRRMQLFGGKPAAETLALGERYLAAGRLSDATDAFEQAKALDRLNEIKRRVLAGDTRRPEASGNDLWLLQRLEKIEGAGPTKEEWRAAGDLALSAGKYLQAATCYEKAGDLAALARAREQVQTLKGELPKPAKSRGGIPLNP
jgi:tetratricopeptide (TPR) repeat protein